MKLVHWIQTPDPKAISGMLSSFRELLEAEIGVLGIQNVGVCNVVDKKGGIPLNLVKRSMTTLPWEPTLHDPDTVHVIHTYPPLSLHSMKRRVFLAHGIPEYCWWDDIYKMGPPVWWQITTLVRLSDATVCWFKRDVEFWEELTDGKISTMRRGVDLSYWTPEGTKMDLYGQRPMVLYADASRLIKLPFTLLFAIKKAQRVLHDTYLKMILSDPPRDIPWTNLITRLEVDHFVPVYYGPAPDVRELFRSVDIGVSPVMWGLISRIPMELMASGTSVICLRGVDDEPIHGQRVDDTPESMANGIIKVWGRIEADPEGERIKARKLAEVTYDIRNSAKDLIKVCEDVM